MWLALILLQQPSTATSGIIRWREVIQEYIHLLLSIMSQIPSVCICVFMFDFSWDCSFRCGNCFFCFDFFKNFRPKHRCWKVRKRPFLCRLPIINVYQWYTSNANKYKKLYISDTFLLPSPYEHSRGIS